MKETKGNDNDFEKIFGEFKKPVNLFDEDEDYYGVLRPHILSHITESYSKGKLPFQGVELIPYPDFMRAREIARLERNGHHIFFIKRFRHGFDSFCDAAGYYNRYSRNFKIIEYSYIVSVDRFGIYDAVLQIKRQKALLSRSKDIGKEKYLTETITCNDPSIAASYVLGRKADLLEWEDRNGKKLVHYYNDLLKPLQENDNNSAISKEKTEKKGSTDKANQSIIQQNNVKGTTAEIQPPRVGKSSSMHIFHLNVPGICNAYGYYDLETNNFFILKNSLVALISEKDYSFTNSGIARARFLNKACKKDGNYFRVVKDAKCRSASAAASYVLGKAVTYVYWIDANGKTLKDCYPQKFFQNNPDLFADASLRVPTVKEINPNQHPFFIERMADNHLKCSAIGYYDPNTNKMLLKEGSVISLEVSKMFQYTAAEFSRRKFISILCNRENNGYKVKHDTLIENPNTAACYVLGQNADGWTEWKDTKGKSLKDFFTKI